MKIVLFALGALALVACSENDGSGDAGADADAAYVYPAECEAIATACHDVDPGSGPIHDCHELAEVSGVTAAACAAKKADCLAVCGAADGGAHDHDGGDGGHGH